MEVQVADTIDDTIEDTVAEVAKPSYKILPVSVIDIEKAGKDKIRGKQDHAKKSPRASYSPFPEEISDLCYEYFLRDKEVIFDPFAGWGERHKKALEYGKQYTGFDTSTLALENAQNIFGVTNIQSDSRVAEIPTHNGLLTCPPYWNLEKYAGDGLDRIKSWKGFLEEYEDVWKRVVKKAEPGAIYCIMVCDWRAKNVYYDLVHQTEHILNKVAIPFDKVVVSRKKITKIKIMLPQAKRLGYTAKVHETLLVYKII